MSDCTIHDGYIRPDGYGIVRARGEAIPRYAHREAWMAAHGAIPDGMHVHHRCHNPSCVNVDHMELLTHAQHSSLHFKQPRPKRAECPNGHAYTEDNVFIRSDGFRSCKICLRNKWRRDPRRRARSA